ncbi:hypothetical protein Tco_0638516 [Tanacetum coccineum]
MSQTPRQIKRDRDTKIPHNIVACLERTEGNVDFHQIVDFLNASTIRYSLTISPTIYASYIEQFWSTAKTKIVNNETQIHSKVDGKTIVLSESSMRSNLHFNDEDGVTSLTNSEILENLALMGYEIYVGNTSSRGEGPGQPSETQPPPSPALPSHEVQVTNVASHPQKTHTPRRAKRGQNTKIRQSSGPPKKVGDEAVYTGEDDRVFRAATTTTSLEAEQESGSGPRFQDTTLEDADAQTRFETASKQSCEPPFSEVNTSGSGEDSIEHQDDLTDFVPLTPYDSPLLGDHTPGSDEGRPNINELMTIYTNLSNRVLTLETSKTRQDLVINKLKKKVKRLEKKLRVRTPGMKLFMIVNIATTEVSAASASVTTTGVTISIVEPRTPPTTTTTFEDKDLTIAQTLVKIRSEKAKVKGVAFRDMEESARPTKILPTIDPKDKGKGIIMLVEMIAERKRFFVAQRAEQIRNKPPTRPQLRNNMVTYLKHMGKYTHNQMKSKSFEEIQKLYERGQKWINDFVPIDSEVVKDSRKGKAAGSRKKIVARKRTGDDEAVNVESLATKYPIVDWKTHALSEDKMYYEIIKGDGKRFETASPEGYDILLWGDLITVFEPIHVLLMDTGIAIHMLIEKTYPLTQEMLSRMLSRRLEVDHECEMAYELLRGGLLGIRGFYDLMLLVQVCVAAED